MMAHWGVLSVPRTVRRNAGNVLLYTVYKLCYTTSRRVTDGKT